jgi:hypothetical protein
MKSLKRWCPFTTRAPFADFARVGKTCWPAPEVPQNLNLIVTFLQTLNDGFVPPAQ